MREGTNAKTPALAVGTLGRKKRDTVWEGRRGGFWNKVTFLYFQFEKPLKILKRRHQKGIWKCIYLREYKLLFLA